MRINWRRRTPKYTCPLCGRKHDTYYMYDVCLALCTKLLEQGKQVHPTKKKGQQ